MTKKLISGFSVLILLLSCVYGQHPAKQLNQFFDSLYTTGRFNGCVLMADSGKVLFKKAYGFADMEKKIPLTLNTRFELASVSKQFTAMAIMQLHAKGKLDYSDRITKYLPDLPYEEVTIADLLHHCSGIEEFLGWGKDQIGDLKSLHNADIEQLLPVEAPHTKLTPGSTFSYANTNYLILADIVEKISGVPFSSYMQTHIFSKAGMTRSFVSSNATSQQADLARDYIWDPVFRKYMHPEQIKPDNYTVLMAGIHGPYGISSTVTDLYNWSQALRTDVLVPDSIWQESFIPKKLLDGEPAGYDPSLPYGFGWLLKKGDKEKGTFMWHTGGIGGFQSLIGRYTIRGLSIIILENRNSDIHPDAMLTPVLQILYNIDSINYPGIQPLKKSRSLSPEYLHRLAGKYASATDSSITMGIRVQNNRLFAKYLDQIEAEIYPMAKDQFFYTVVDATVEFKKEEGIYHQLTLIQNGEKTILNRQ